jgi:hypothetical protein
LLTRLRGFIVAHLLHQSLQFLQALDQIQQLDGLDRVADDAKGSPDLASRMPTGQVAFQGFDGLAGGLLQQADGGLHDAPPRQAVGGLELG